MMERRRGEIEEIDDKKWRKMVRWLTREHERWKEGWQDVANNGEMKGKRSLNFESWKQQ